MVFTIPVSRLAQNNMCALSVKKWIYPEDILDARFPSSKTSLTNKLSRDISRAYRYERAPENSRCVFSVWKYAEPTNVSVAQWCFWRTLCLLGAASATFLVSAISGTLISVKSSLVSKSLWNCVIYYALCNVRGTPKSSPAKSALRRHNREFSS